MDNEKEKRYEGEENSGEPRKDGQAATNESVMDGLMENAWFPAVYADQFGTTTNGLVPDFPDL